MSDSRSSPPLLRMSTLRGPVVPVVDFPGAGAHSSMRSFAATPPPSQVPPMQMLAEDIKITIPDLLREPETSRPFAPRPKRLLQRGALVRNLEGIVETQARQQEQDAALARLPGMMNEMKILDSEKGQRSRKRGRESAEDAVQVEHRARRHHALPSDSAPAVAGGTGAISRKATGAREPSRAGHRAHAGEAPQLPGTSARRRFEDQTPQNHSYDADGFLDARAKRQRRASTAPPMAE